jgi:hypothetical protein
LADGRVLIIGGVQEKYPPSTTVHSIQPEIYDPSDGTFTVLATYHEGYSSSPWMPHVILATQLNNGTIFISTGTTSTAVLDPISGTVLQSASTLYPRTSMAPLTDGRVLLLGGSMSPTSAEVFDPAMTSRGFNQYRRQSATVIGSSTLLDSALTASRTDGIAQTLLSDGRLMFSGGITASYEYRSSVDIFDPTTMQFMSNPPAMPITRAFHNTATFVDGMTMIFGGSTELIPRGTGTYRTKLVSMFDPTTNTFTSGYGDLTTPRVNAPAVQLNDGTILIVGDDGSSGSPAGSNAWTAEIYTFG